MADHTFENFQVHPGNQEALSFCKAILAPGTLKCSPLFMYGDKGVGKTHLCHAVVKAVRDNHPDWIVNHISVAKFLEEFYEAIKRGKGMEFTKIYYESNALIIDDVHLLAYREIAQMVIYTAITHILDQSKERPVVFTSLYHPNKLVGIQERVLSFFKAGVVVEILT